jgi:AraC family transcriptional regulator
VSTAPAEHHGQFSRVALKSFPSRHALPWHAHPHACVCVLLTGSMFEALGDFGQHVATGTLIYKPPALPHRNVFTTSARVLTIELNGLRSSRPGGTGMPDYPVTVRSERIRRLGQHIASELSGGVVDAASALLVDGLGLELISEVPRSIVRPRDRVPGWLELIHARLTAEFRAPETIAGYAESAGVHPTYLARMFKNHFGESIGRYVRQLRIDFAARQLSLTNEPIARIALSAGFADQSHFTHAFRREKGMNPGAFRRRQR